MATKTEHSASAAAHDDTTISRRRFLTRLSLGLGGIGAALVGVPVLGFLLAPLLRQVPEEWQTVGPIDQFAIGEARLITLTDPSPLPWAGVAARTANHTSKHVDIGHAVPVVD